MSEGLAERRRELGVLCAIAREAGRAIVASGAQDRMPSYKAGGEVVTRVDRRVNQLIHARLRASFPGEPIVAEESDPRSYLDFAAASRIFFVDPLDGTAELLAQNGEFSVLIGVVEGERAALGVVHAPELRRTWIAARGSGAWVTEENGAEREIHASSTDQLRQARIVASRSHRSAALQRALSCLRAREVIGLGSAGLKGARVADGSADAFVAVGVAGKLWDVCAIDALVSAAGGLVTDTLGRPMNYRRATVDLSCGIIAANPALHRILAEQLASLPG